MVMVGGRSSRRLSITAFVSYWPSSGSGPGAEGSLRPTCVGPPPPLNSVHSPHLWSLRSSLLHANRRKGSRKVVRRGRPALCQYTAATSTIRLITPMTPHAELVSGVGRGGAGLDGAGQDLRARRLREE
ncbi:hypothetical protein E2C01_085887 [Portunus trituberculatus]|uniref:Uncharacterized protein n=1 Tax=Portunus trituberculatus TaxID=210409 RepID=A0A5B7J8T3_PORTR|nr:hypothetical protein [Portunus trituberculatus]